MKRVLVVACGLSMVSTSQGKMDVSLSNMKDVADAINNLPGNLIKIQNLVQCRGGKNVEGDCSTGKNFDDTYKSLQQNLDLLGKYKKGATVGGVTIQSRKRAGIKKLMTLKNILVDSSTFIGLSHDFITIVKDGMISPILAVFGQQDLVKPITDVDYVAVSYKTKLDSAIEQVNGILVLVDMLTDTPEEDLSPKQKENAAKYSV